MDWKIKIMKSKISWKRIEHLEEMPELVLNTAIGPFKSNDQGSPLASFKFHLMSTNFKITEEIGARLNRTNGVSSLIFLSPYSVCLSFGELFDEVRVKQNIELQLVGKILNTNLESKDVPESLLNKIKVHSMLFPNGEIVPIDEDNSEISKECMEMVGGVII